MTARFRKWCFTINNPSPSELHISNYTFAKKYAFQLEKGENDTKHIQGVLELTHAKTLTALKKLMPRAHLESCKSIANSIAYCTKEETRIGGPWLNGFSQPYIRRPIKLISNLYPWQKNVIELIDKEADDRTINWWVDQDGGAGKTALCKYICANYNAILVGGKGDNILYGVTQWCLDEKKCDDLIVLFDFERSIEDYISYSAIEKIKNGLWYSGKYEGSMVIINSPHILVFSNFMPKVDSLTLDRWHLFISDNNKFSSPVTGEGFRQMED